MAPALGTGALTASCVSLTCLIDVFPPPSVSSSIPPSLPPSPPPLFLQTPLRVAIHAAICPDRRKVEPESSSMSPPAVQHLTGRSSLFPSLTGTFSSDGENLAPPDLLHSVQSSSLSTGVWSSRRAAPAPRTEHTEEGTALGRRSPFAHRPCSWPRLLSSAPAHPSPIAVSLRL